MWYRDEEGVDKLIGTGYSGAAGITKNNTHYQDIHDEGPIPVGVWSIQGPPIDTSSHGPFVLHLFAESATQTFGRSGFLIHGDSKIAPGNASLGCIVLDRSAREKIWEIKDSVLRVIDKFAESKNKDEGHAV